MDLDREEFIKGVRAKIAQIGSPIGNAPRPQPTPGAPQVNMTQPGQATPSPHPTPTPAPIPPANPAPAAGRSQGVGEIPQYQAPTPWQGHVANAVGNTANVIQRFNAPTGQIETGQGGLADKAVNYASQNFDYKTNDSILGKLHPGLQHTSVGDGISAAWRGVKNTAADAMQAGQDAPSGMLGPVGNIAAGVSHFGENVGGNVKDSLQGQATKDLSSPVTDKLKQYLGIETQYDRNGAPDIGATAKGVLGNLDQGYRSGTGSVVDTLTEKLAPMLNLNQQGTAKMIGDWVKDNPYIAGAGLLGGGAGLTWLISKLFGGGQQQQQPQQYGPPPYPYYMPPQQPPPQAMAKYSSEQLYNSIVQL